MIPVEGLVILKELSERLKEEPELWPLDVVITVRVLTLGHILSVKFNKTLLSPTSLESVYLDVVEAPIDGWNCIKELVHSNDIPHPLQ